MKYLLKQDQSFFYIICLCVAPLISSWTGENIFLKSSLLGAQGKSERWITVKVYVWHNWAWLAIIPICLISDIAVNKSFFIFTKKIIFHVIIKIM